ncbi:MAG: hypothetical protein L6R38_000708 [Xanthoria sp. 2 TBL-2021]|nr:MAG: hypothetical protein L6R38_000708 [Xanthoria sp. 2 TBL-2021]
MTEEFCTKGSNDKKGCQSNCDQPGSGASGGDVQSRVIGYYESWAHARTCSGMDFKDIPVEGLTHLYFSFGYITPGDFNIAPMDNAPSSLFSDLTDLKKKNSGLKAVIALGGWTFNDNGTATQPVFSNMVSSAGNRAKFIINLLGFLREYAFDGVDFDWEYPGALLVQPDRGGHPDDGKKFTVFLSELKDAIGQQPAPYEVSFTVPTSYWYLRWFDLKAVDHVDFLNVMSYDLHGVWDSTNPIGSHVLAHTNLTEIRQAFDLFWRNDVPANKLNLGLGFYGRSFQLSDPSCYKPGCNFKGGASPGACTKNSGTLSYKEITQIIDQKKIKPYYDEENAVKYIVWDQDQWVSYDDEETFKQKIEFGNELGLGGLLIWAIDQDTDDLKALNAVLAPKSVKAFAQEAENADYWKDATAADCYVSNCGESCKTGFIPVTNQPCGEATFFTRNSEDEDSSLCCPLDAAPNPDKCVWRGTAPSCNGRCHDGEVTVQQNKWGDGKYCEDGNKAYCCEVTNDKQNDCYWTGTGGSCEAGDKALTFAGTFLGDIADFVDLFPDTLIGDVLEDGLDQLDMELEKRYCCPPDDFKKWTNCHWYGEPGSCFDNHCNLGHQVQLATNAYGLGRSCSPRLERERVFCCDASSGASPFLPVPLENLFPHPPEGDDVDTDFDLQVDNTWGDGQADTADDEPNEASFGFVVITSPEELQVSLDKRDGSHWELFNCNDALSEEEQTVQMFCTDFSENSTCHKISLGYGVPGTILEMPKGCGPSKYAVAKSMMLSEVQLPTHLAKRHYDAKPVVYDLTFDFDWRRVPRDLGDTQMRVDFSNEVGYWDSIVSKAAKHKRKRSLEHVGGKHKRWLEEAWRDDAHFGGLPHEELHKRWFGPDAIAWLKGFFNPSIKPEFTHNIDTTFTAQLINEKWGPCTVGGVQVDAKLLAQALATVKVGTSFGFTLITKLRLPLDLSQSYLYFKNKGDVSATFTLDAVGKAVFETGDIEIAGLENFPGATFGIPKLLTVGPNFKLIGAVDAEVTLSGHLESKVQIAAWDIQQTYPDQGAEWDPKSLSPPNRDGTGSFQGITQPTFDYSVTATGQITAHLKPTIEFGIVFDKMWNVESAKVDVVADGWVRLKASAGVSSSGNCPFTYGIDVGADLFATVSAPKAFGWAPRSFPIASLPAKAAKEGGTCPSKQKRDVYTAMLEPALKARDMGNTSEHALVKRALVGPLLSLPQSCFFCPTPDSGTVDCASISGYEPEEVDDPDRVSRRDLSDHYNYFEKRAPKVIEICGGTITVTSPKFDSSGRIIKTSPNIGTYGFTNPSDCNDYGFGSIAKPSGGTGPGKSDSFATEHILEFQLLPIFLEEQGGTFSEKEKPNSEIYLDPEGGPNKIGFCEYLEYYWSRGDRFWVTVGGNTRSPLQHVAYQYPGKDSAYNAEFVLLDKEVNRVKEGMWGKKDINSDDTMTEYEQTDPEKAVKNLKDVAAAYKYHQIHDVNIYLLNQGTRVGNMFKQMEDAIFANDKSYERLGLKDKWDTWIKGRTDRARTRAETYMTGYLQKLRSGYATDYHLSNAAFQDQKLLEHIQSLTMEIKGLTPWANPFP